MLNFFCYITIQTRETLNVFTDRKILNCGGGLCTEVELKKKQNFLIFIFLIFPPIYILENTNMTKLNNASKDIDIQIN